MSIAGWIDSLNTSNVESLIDTTLWTNMTHPTFELLRKEKIDSLNIEFQEYKHTKTGAHHYHLASDDNNNVFLVAFQTVPQDSTGVAHILEHTSLCGSQKFPVRDPFFMMTRRSLSTFMNAFTASDWTAYPFATQSEKDFDNLLQVYLDATFFPNLDPLDFAQEGHRLEFNDTADPESPLQYKGVVFNEMKGAMSSPVQRIWQDLQSALFPTNTYHYNSGGEPQDIPNLTHDQLTAFHAAHYHPSNAYFMTYGNLDAATHQAKFEAQVLQHFDYAPLELNIADEQRYTSPQVVKTRYAVDANESTQQKTHIVVGWLLDRINKLEETVDAQLLSSVLLDNSASPLRQALETTDLANAPSELCGMEDSLSEAVFVCGVEGSEAEHSDAIEQLILDVIQQVAKEGVPQSQLEAILHQTELAQREVGGGHIPYGLQMMMKLLSPTLHGADPVAVLNIDPLLQRLQEKIKDPEYIKGVAQKLLDNPHRIRLTAEPDNALAKVESDAEAERLATLQATLTDADKSAIIEATHALKERQEQEDDPSVLPCVTIADAPKTLLIPTGTQRVEDQTTVDQFAVGTNGLAYQQIITELTDIPEHLLDALPLFCECITELGAAGEDYLALQTRQAAISGGISARIAFRTDPYDTQKVKTQFILSGKALVRNHQSLTNLLQDVFTQARFDELDRIRELIAQIRAHRESTITQSGHQLAMVAASSGHTPYGQLSHRWDGLEGIRTTIALDNKLQDNDELQRFAGHLQELQTLITQSPRKFLIVSEQKTQEALTQHIHHCWQDKTNNAAVADDATSSFTPSPVHTAWVTSTQVNFCAAMFPAVPAAHADAPALTVLGHYLRNGYLHRAIREQGGAYGGGASFSADAAAFRFFSYRDPRLEETLEDFKHSVDWLNQQAQEPRQLEEAILGVISDIDKPSSPAGEAIGTYYANEHGRTSAFRNQFRQAIMQVTFEDLQRVASTYLTEENMHVSIITNSDTLAAYQSDSPRYALEAHSLTQ